MNTYKLTQTGPETQDILDEVNVLREDVDTNTEDIEQLQELYEAFINGGVVIIQPTDTWPVANPTQTAIYRVIDRENTPPEYYADYMWNGTSFVKMAQYDNNIDDEPTADSDNLVRSGGVFNYVATNGSAFDISVANASGGVPAEYADLSAALGTNGANVPSAVRKGGMSVKFIQQTPASYSVVVTPGAAEAPTGGVLLDADPEITSGSHTASDLTALSTGSALPTTVGGAKTYYFAVTGDTTTYTTLVVTLVQNSDHKYVRYNYQISSVDSDDFTNVGNWIGVDDTLENVSEISKEYVSNGDEEFRFESNNGDLIGHVTNQGADFVEIKKNGKTVATEDELPIIDKSIGETPSNSNVPTTKAVKDYVDENCTGSFPMSEETIQSGNEEFLLSDDAGNETYVKMGSYGIKALAYLDINGNPIVENSEKAVTKGLFYDEGDKFLITGASFVTANGSDSGWAPEINGYNRWFEDACNKLQVTPINHAIGGQSILNTASMMRDANSTKPHGSLFMDDGVDIFDDVSVFVIMHVHNQNVFYTGAKKLADYISGGVSGYAEAYDYVIKQYEQWCIDAGKYCQILLCTHWHDARVTYNQSIRKVGIKWGLPVCQFDAEIGFSKNTPLDNGKQISVYNSWDPSGQMTGSVETINGVVYGWHMKKPTYTSVDNYQLSDIQKRMSKIFQKCFI